MQTNNLLAHRTKAMPSASSQCSLLHSSQNSLSVVPIDTMEPLPVPYGGSAEHIDKVMTQFLLTIFNSQQMNNVSKFFLVMVGLPGLGKSTLTKQVKHCINANFNGQLTNCHPDFSVKFEKISYDRILCDLTDAYKAKHPDVEYHHIIDIIRADADRQYLEQIASKFTSSETKNSAQSAITVSQENAHPNQFVTQRVMKEIIVCDRNNTFDIWPDFKKTVDTASRTHKFMNYKTLIMLPMQKPFDHGRYLKVNPICPELTYESIKRIFGRVKHGCLNGSNKPKAVEVVLKFVKLYDGANFQNKNHLKQYFDAVIDVDFLSNSTPMDVGVHDAFIQAYNETPENFGVPSDGVINKIIQVVEHQMQLDEQYYELNKNKIFNGPTDGVLQSSQIDELPCSNSNKDTLVLGEISSKFTNNLNSQGSAFIHI